MLQLDINLLSTLVRKAYALKRKKNQVKPPTYNTPPHTHTHTHKQTNPALQTIETLFQN